MDKPSRDQVEVLGQRFSLCDHRSRLEDLMMDDAFLEGEKVLLYHCCIYVYY